MLVILVHCKCVNRIKKGDALGTKNLFSVETQKLMLKVP